VHADTSAGIAGCGSGVRSFAVESIMSPRVFGAPEKSRYLGHSGP
jgi:hypothetical protein